MTPSDFRAIRKAARMTQAQMAERLGVSRKTIVNWETAIFAIPDTVLETLEQKGVEAAPAPAKVLSFLTHPQMFQRHSAGAYLRNHLHPHWYLRSTALAPYLTPEQRKLADAFITTVEHAVGHVPMTPENAVAFLQSFGMPELQARQVVAKTGFAVTRIAAPLSDDDLLRD